MAMCRECPTQIVWVKTRSGKSMAVNATPGGHTPNIAVQRVNGQLVDARVITADRPAGVHEEVFVAHFVTCPRANELRRQRQSTTSTRKTTSDPNLAGPALF